MSRKKFTSVLLAFALVTVPLLTASFQSVNAAKLTNVSNVLSDSGIGELSDHEITFTSTSGIAAAGSITLAFDEPGDNFDFGSVALADIDMLTGTCGSESGVTLAGTPTGTTWGVTVNSGTDTIVFTSGTDTVAVGECVVILIGTNASGTNQITNPSSGGVYDIDVTAGSDDGVAKVAVLSHVDVDVTVDETLTFTVTGQTAASCETTADVDTTATAISYGSVNANTFYDACQQLLVSTNATGGYSVTIQQTQDLTSGALDTIAAGTCDGGCDVDTAAAWTTNTNNGFGFCIDNVTGTDGVATATCTAGGATHRTFGTLGTDTPEVIMSNGSVVNANEIELNARISVSGSQPAGTYQNELLYVATPTY